MPNPVITESFAALRETICALPSSAALSASLRQIAALEALTQQVIEAASVPVIAPPENPFETWGPLDGAAPQPDVVPVVVDAFQALEPNPIDGASL